MTKNKQPQALTWGEGQRVNSRQNIPSEGQEVNPGSEPMATGASQILTYDQTLYENYMTDGYKPILCNGYHKNHNPLISGTPTEEQYKAAKIAFEKGYTEPDFKQSTYDQVNEHYRAGGWVGWLLPKGVIALDVDKGPDDPRYFEGICQAQGIKPGIHVSRYGKHGLFKTERDLPGRDKVFTRSGLEVTYRVGGKNYLILAPCDNRKWEHWRPVKDLPELPGDFLGYDRKNKADVLNCFAWQVSKAKRKDIFGTYEDLQGFMALLIENGMSEDEIRHAFELVFLSQYDEKKTLYHYERTRAMIDKGDPVIGAGSFVQKAKEAGLELILKFARELTGKRTVKGETSRSSQDPVKEKNTTHKKLELTSLSDLYKEPDEAVSFLVDKMLPTSGFSLLAGKTKAGKSTLARNLALKIARGEDFLNRATQQGSVIYLALEEKRAEIKRHFKALGATGEESIFIFASVAPQDGIRQLTEIAKERKPALIIVDPLFRLARVKDGNDYAQMTQALEPLLAIARAGSHVMLIHHAKKGAGHDGDSILGSTAIFGSVDTAIFLKRTERYRIISTLQRYGEDLEETVLNFDSEKKETTIGRSKDEEEMERVKAAIIEFLKPPTETVLEKQINDKVEGKINFQRTALRDLVKNGNVRTSGKGVKGDPYYYALNNFGEDHSQEKKEQPKKNACILVSTIHREQEYKNSKNAENPHEYSPNSCFHDFTKTGNLDEISGTRKNFGNKEIIIGGERPCSSQT